MSPTPLHRRLRLGGLIVAELLALDACLFSVRQFAHKIALSLAGFHGPDADFYTIMGQVIRNHLTIYKDVFDPKPPGMFLLSAASFSLFHDRRLGAWLTVLILLALPLLFLFFGWKRARSMQKTQRFLLIQSAVAIGIILALYNATIGGDWQTEFFGAFGGLLYVAAIDCQKRHAHWAWIASASIAFSLTLLLKEPFLLTLSAAALLLLRTKKEWLTLWLIPFASACLTYLVTLVSLGAFGSYIGIYLRAMFGSYIVRSGPVWARGLVAWERIWTNMLDFTPWFFLVIGVLFFLSLPKAKTKRENFLRASSIATFASLILIARSLTSVALPWKTSVATAVAVAIMGGLCLVWSAWKADLRGFLRRSWRHALGFYLTITAIGLGSDFHGQYFALAIPFYSALFLLLANRLAATDEERLPSSVPVIITALCAAVILTSTPFIPQSTTLTAQISTIRTEEQADRTAAAAVDQILDACKIDRYYFLENRAYAPYTRHSPLNYYLYTRIEHIDRYHPEFFDESFRRLRDARIVILSKPYEPIPRAGNATEQLIGEKVKAFLADRFTPVSWACAKDLPNPRGYLILYRKDMADRSLPFFQIKSER